MYIQKKYLKLLLFILILLFCCSKEYPLGSKKNPIKMYFVPSVESGKILSDGKKITELIQEETGYYFSIAVPTSYAAVIEAMGTEEADIAWLPPFAYIIAQEKYNAEVGLITIRNKLKQYRGQFIARTESKIDTIYDINNKTIAYSDAASTSGYIYPYALLKKLNINPKRSFFAGGHTQVIIAVYEGTADVGCTFWSPERNNKIHDARMHVIDTYPDVVEKTKIIGFTEWIPNDTVTFRKGLPNKIKNDITKAIIKIADTKKGKKIFKDIYDIDGFVKAKDSDYDGVRNTLKILNKNAEQFIK